MMAQMSDLKWGRVVVAGVVTTVLAFAVVFLVVTVYAASLAAQAQEGAPDPDQIARFAEGTGAWLGPVLALLFTAGAAWLVARSGASEAATRHGLVVGLVVAVVGLALGGPFGVGALVGFGLTVGAGWMGGRLGKRGRLSSQNAPSTHSGA